MSEYYDYDAWERNNYRNTYDDYDNEDYEYDCYKDDLLMQEMMYEETMSNE